MVIRKSRIIFKFERTRQIIRYRATATIKRPQINQYIASNKGAGLQTWEHHIIFTKYEAVHPMALSENNSSLGMPIIFTNTRPYFYFQ